jgi:hypothetical protein
MTLNQLLPRTELLLRSRTLHAEHFRKGSKNVDATARNNPKKRWPEIPAALMKKVAQVYRRVYSVSYINVKSLKFIETCFNGRYIFMKRGTSL